MRCSPALKTLRNVLEKKDLEIYELQNRLKKIETEIRSNEELKKQISFLKKQNDEYKTQLRSAREELSLMKKNSDKLSDTYDKLVEDVKPKNELTRDLKSLLATQDYSDCVINCSGEKYQAHKCILTIRSEYLAKALKAPPPNAQVDPKTKPKTSIPSLPPTPTVELVDIDPEVMPFIMNYLYTGETDNISDRNVQGVMKAADRLELNGLRGACLAFMENRINRFTCIPILIEAYELNHERLKNKCLKYMQSENIDLVNSPQWNNFKTENPKLALSLYERYVKEQAFASTSFNSKKDQTPSENGQFTSRSLNPIKNPIPSNNWNPNNSYVLNNSNKVMNGGNKNIIVDR